jgi:hypothetical protein
MPKSAAAIFLALVVAACGAIGGGQPSLQPPPAPTEALAHWSDFPVHLKPRPIIWFGDVVETVGEGQFGSEAAKEAWICRKFVLARGIELTTGTAGPGSARWASGVSAVYATTIGSKPAFAAIESQRGGDTAMCDAARPFTIRSVHLDVAKFATDRGGADMTAWVFDIPDIHSSVAYPALGPSAYWGGKATYQAANLAAQLGGDGKTLTISVVGGPERGPCGSDFATAVAESSTAVAVAIKSYPHDAQAVCDLVAYSRTVTVHLKAPLGDRVLLDENGNAGTAST